MNINDLLNEALPLKTAKKYRQAWDPNFHREVFERQARKDRQAYRIYLPFEEAKRKKVTIPQELIDYLATAIPNRPYTTDEELYVKGLARETNNPTRTVGIGKMLATSISRSKDPQQKADLDKLKLEFDKDPQRAATRKSDLLIAISRHPYDVAGMSTDRGWSSCMNLVDGENRRYVLRDVKQGSIIAYLVRGDDLNINRPMARMLIKPYAEKGKTNNLVMMGDVVYGTPPHGFKQQVDAWIDQNYNKNKSGLFCLKPGLYRDDIPQKITLLSDEDIRTLPISQLITLADIDEGDKLWPRIARLRPNDSDAVFNGLVNAGWSRAISFVKHVDLAVFKKQFQKNPNVFKYLNQQDPAIVEWVLSEKPNFVRFLKERTPQQQQLLNKMIKKDPYLIERVTNPTKQQLLMAVKSRPGLSEWVLTNHANQFDDAEMFKLFYQALEQGDPEYELMDMMVSKFPQLKLDPKFVKSVLNYARNWAIANMELDANTVQDLVISLLKDYGRVDNKVIDMLRQVDPSEGKPELIKLVLAGYRQYDPDEDLVKIVINWDPRKVGKYVKDLIGAQPTVIRWINSPSGELIQHAIESAFENGLIQLTEEFDYEEHKSMWHNLLKKDLGYIRWIKNPSRSLLKSVIDASDPVRDEWVLGTLLNQVDVGLQVRIIKRAPKLIEYVSKPGFAVQMAALNADPTTIKLIKPKDQHPSAKIFVRTYNREMKRLEKEDQQ
jgi:hypothetical protein